MRRPLRPLLLLALLLLSFSVARGEEDPKKAEATAVARMRDREVSARLDGVKLAFDLPGKAVTAELVKLLRDPEAQVRAEAIGALGARTGDAEKRVAAEALAFRLTPLSKSSADLDEYHRVIAALSDLAQTVSIKALLEMSVDEDRETAAARLMAVAEVPSPEAIEALINFASKGRDRGRGGQKKLAIQALRAATGEKLSEDPDAWRAWWRGAKDKFDFAAATKRRDDARRAAEERARRKEERKEKAAEKKAKKQADGGGDGGGDGKESGAGR